MLKYVSGTPKHHVAAAVLTMMTTVVTTICHTNNENSRFFASSQTWITITGLKQNKMMITSQRVHEVWQCFRLSG